MCYSHVHDKILIGRCIDLNYLMEMDKHTLIGRYVRLVLFDGDVQKILIGQ